MIRYAAAGVLSAVLLANCGSPPPPPDAEQVAAQLGAVGCHDDTSGPHLYWATACRATWHGRKVGIDTFATQEIRDKWLQASEPFGVSPVREGPTWVVYWSVTS